MEVPQKVVLRTLREAKAELESINMPRTGNIDVGVENEVGMILGVGKIHALIQIMESK